MGKKSDAKKGKMDDPSEKSDAKRAEDVDDSSRHESTKKKNKRKHESGGVVDELASTGITSENVSGVVDAESKSELRKKRKLDDLDSGRELDLEKTKKKDKKRRHGEIEAEPRTDAVPSSAMNSDNKGNDKKYEKESLAHDDDDDDIRSKSEGVKSKTKNKKHKRELEGGQGIVEKGKKKGMEGNERVDQLDSENGGNKKTKKEKKKEEEKKKQEGEGEGEKKSKKDKRAKESSRKVRFSDKVEIFPSPHSQSEGNAKEKDQLVRGKRFSPEEDALIIEAVNRFIEDRGLGEDGLNMVLHCKEHREIRKSCWKEIGAALPWRPNMSVYYRAHILFERGETRSWTEEEREMVKKYHAEHGSDWRTLADALGKHRFHVKDLWRRIKLPNLKKGNWSQEEYQALFDLVNTDLQMKALDEKVSKHGMIRDNISWEAISEKLSTRTNMSCCLKWYEQLTSPMVAEKEWDDADDYRLLDTLVSLDACSMEDVDWDCLIETRSGSVCRKRWAQMVKYIGEHGTKSFAEQVEILSKRYCPDLIEVREACDKKRLEE